LIPDNEAAWTAAQQHVETMFTKLLAP